MNGNTQSLSPIFFPWRVRLWHRLHCNVFDSVDCNIMLFQSVMLRFVYVFYLSEQDIVLSVVRKLGGFFIEDRVSSSTSHVIAGSPRRTLNVLMAIAQGSWLVSPMWVRTLCIPIRAKISSKIEY